MSNNTKLNIKSNENDNTKDESKRDKSRSRKLAFITVISAILLIFAVYAWFSATLNVKIRFFNMSVATDTGLFISLDGIDFDSEVTVSMDSILNDLTPRYPNHLNRWAISGLWSVSSNGIKNSSRDKFDMYYGEVVRRRPITPTSKRLLHTMLEVENRATPSSTFIAFDFFLKNVSGSPNPDNLYFNEDTYVDFAETVDPDIKDEMQGVLNSLRFGIVFMGSVPLNADVQTIQNIQCNNACKSVIYEPNSRRHSFESIAKAKELGINLVNGIYTPTYGVVNEGSRLEHTNGHLGTGIPLDTAHFAPQNTITNFDTIIHQIPNGITKCRGYFWVEGQDIDSLETNSKGAKLEVLIGLIKDLAGYE